MSNRSMQPSASDILLALLVSGEHSVLLDHIDSMNHPHEEEKTVQSTESSRSGERNDTTMSALATAMNPNPRRPLHLSTADIPEEGAVSQHTKKAPKKRKWRKPKDMPKRPLSAYNIFFQNERKKLAVEKLDVEAAAQSASSSMGFAGLAQNVASKWRSLDASARAYYDAEAGKDQIRYRQEVDEWKRRKGEQMKEESGKYDSEPSIGTSRFNHTQIDNSSSLAQQLSGLSPPIGAEVALWPSMPQTIESLGSLYDANIDLSDVNQFPECKPEVSQEGATVTDCLEPDPINPAQLPDSSPASLDVTAASSLQRLFSEMEDEELDFLTSLRDLK